MNCDRIARWYRWMEFASFGRELHRRRRHFLPGLKAQKVLLLGDGDGRFLADFTRQCPEARLDYVDISREMLTLASERTPRSDYAHFHQLDALSDELPGGGYDLVITHFFLDCFGTEELRRVVAKIGAAATPHARWIVSEFHQPASGWQRIRAKLWIEILYLAFGLLTGLDTRRLPDYESVLPEYGFRRVSQKLSSAGLLRSELWQR
jgi:ubiquinone/menaquinone biosynthesis C-methylase UbiE